jgi:hypothetical protein
MNSCPPIRWLTNVLSFRDRTPNEPSSKLYLIILESLLVYMDTYQSFIPEQVAETSQIYLRDI